MERGVPVRGHEGAKLDSLVRRELRERQKHELRGERDRVILDLADSLGLDGLAHSLGTTRATAETLVLRARERVASGPRRITARRISRDPERWSEADRHFEALGRSVRLPPHAP
jgi:hypothetical protein